jgi:hypothetical protein
MLRISLGANRRIVLPYEGAGGTVQADAVVMLHVALDQTLRLFQRQRRARLNALAFQRLVPALTFIGLTLECLLCSISTFAM